MDMAMIAVIKMQSPGETVMSPVSLAYELFSGGLGNKNVSPYEKTAKLQLPFQGQC
jgi:hypothetical protein